MLLYIVVVVFPEQCVDLKMEYFFLFSSRQGKKGGGKGREENESGAFELPFSFFSCSGLYSE